MNFGDRILVCCSFYQEAGKNEDENWSLFNGLNMHQNIVEIENIGAVHIGDDLSYNQGPMISPAMLRKYVFPWHKHIADNAHAKGLPFTFHSDGNNDIIMNDLI